jgi:hypothetical protein
MPAALREDGLCSLKVYIAMMRCNPHEDHGSFAFNPPNAVQKNSLKSSKIDLENRTESIRQT